MSATTAWRAKTTCRRILLIKFDFLIHLCAATELDWHMDMSFEHLASGVLLVGLRGRLDVTGAMQIDVRFTAAVSASRAVIADMSEILASIGLRTLILGAKSILSKKGRIAPARTSNRSWSPAAPTH
jgi:hypothetical protein